MIRHPYYKTYSKQLLNLFETKKISASDFMRELARLRQGKTPLVVVK